MLKFEGEWAEKLETWYRSPDVESQRDFVLNAVQAKENENILDIGFGPGILACKLATAVGNHGLVYGIDVSETMLDMAKKRCSGIDCIQLEIGDACDLKHPKGEKFDCIVSTQVYEYVSDIDKALSEAYNILKPGGRVIILDTDFDSVVWHSKNPERMKKLLLAYDEHLVHPHLPQFLRSRLEKAGFKDVDTSVFCICNSDLREDTYSFGLLSTISEFVVGRQGITQDESKAWKDELFELDKTHEYFFSLNRYLFVAHKPE